MIYGEGSGINPLTISSHLPMWCDWMLSFEFSIISKISEKKIPRLEIILRNVLAMVLLRKRTWQHVEISEKGAKLEGCGH